MIQTAKAIIEEPDEIPNEAALLATAALAVDWDRPEEDAAWQYLQLDEALGMSQQDIG